MTEHRPWTPDWISPHPGETLAEVLAARGMTQVELSRRTGLSTKHLNQIIKGVIGISVHVAVDLEKATGVKAIVWLMLDAQHRLDVYTKGRR